MPNLEMFLKIISISMIIIMVFPLSVSAEDRFLDTKMVGKLTMIAILSAVTVVVKMLVDRDRGEAAILREKLGLPDSSIQFQKGFDHWQVEWYKNNVYIFRNGFLYKQHPKRGAKFKGER